MAATYIHGTQPSEQVRVVGARGKDAILREIQPHIAA